MGNFTKKLKKKSMSNVLETSLYRVKHFIKAGIHFFECTDYNGKISTCFIPAALFNELTEEVTPAYTVKNIMRGFGDITTILACREDLRPVFYNYNQLAQVILLVACGIYHNTILDDSSTKEDIEATFNDLYEGFANTYPDCAVWFEAYTKTFVDMGNQIGWSPVAMKLEA